MMTIATMTTAPTAMPMMSIFCVWVKLSKKEVGSSGLDDGVEVGVELGLEVGTELEGFSGVLGPFSPTAIVSEAGLA